MTVVYIDILFLLNWVANYLLLLAGGRMAGVVLRRGWLALAAAIGALYAAAVFLPGMDWLSAWPCKGAAGVLMTLVAYGAGKHLLRASVMFFGASFVLGGLVLAVELMGGGPLTVENGVFYSRFDLRLLLVLFVLCYFVLSLFFRRVGRHGARETAKLDIQLLGNGICLTVLIDTGNTLTDPATNRPVVVVDYRAVRHLLPPEIDPRQPVESAEVLHSAGIKSRLIPFWAVGTEYGMLLAVRADEVCLNGKSLGALLIGLSPDLVSDGGGYQGLIGGV